MNTPAIIGIVLTLSCISTPGQTVAPATVERTYPDSADGVKVQIVESVHAIRSSDQTAIRMALDSLGIPNASTWFATHFDARFLAKLPQDYAAALSRFQSHISWVAVNFSKFDDFGLSVEALDNPSPLRDSGFESLLPRPLDAVKVEDYRFQSTSSDPKHGPPSWVSSFVHIDGQFRFVGGTYPFWAEGLTALRGPMSMPPTVIHGRVVQGIAFRKDQQEPGIDAIIQLKISIGRSGHVDHIKVLSGEEPFVQDAKDYVKAADFGSLPDVPQLANARREWDMQIAFFSPKR